MQIMKIGITCWLCVAVLCGFIRAGAEDNLAGKVIKDGYYEIFSQALAADGSTVSLISKDKGTVELWFKLNSISGKGGCSIFCFGDRAWNNSIMMFADSKFRAFFARVSADRWAGQICFAYPIVLNKWYHVALQWQNADGKLEIDKVNCFINGQKIAGERKTVMNNKSGRPGWLGGGLGDSAPYYFMLGGVKTNTGELDKNLLPDFELAQLKISSELLYGQEFTPQAILPADDKTMLLIVGDKEKLTAKGQKQPNSEIINVEVKQEKF